MTTGMAAAVAPVSALLMSMADGRAVDTMRTPCVAERIPRTWIYSSILIVVVVSCIR